MHIDTKVTKFIGDQNTSKLNLKKVVMNLPIVPEEFPP